MSVILNPTNGYFLHIPDRTNWIENKSTSGFAVQTRSYQSNPQDTYQFEGTNEDSVRFSSAQPSAYHSFHNYPNGLFQGNGRGGGGLPYITATHGAGLDGTVSVTSSPPYNPVWAELGVKTDTGLFSLPFDSLLPQPQKTINRLDIKLDVDPTGLPKRFGNLTGGQPFDIVFLELKCDVMIGVINALDFWGSRYWWYPQDSFFVRKRWSVTDNGSNGAGVVWLNQGSPHVSLFGANVDATHNQTIGGDTFFGGNYYLPQVASIYDQFASFSGTGFHFFGWGTIPIGTGEERQNSEPGILSFQANYLSYSILWGNGNYQVISQEAEFIIKEVFALGATEVGRKRIEETATITDFGLPTEAFANFPVSPTAPTDFIVNGYELNPNPSYDGIVPAVGSGSGGVSFGDSLGMTSNMNIGTAGSELLTGAKKKGALITYSRNSVAGMMYMVAEMKDQAIPLLSGQTMPSPFSLAESQLSPNNISSDLSLTEKAASSERKDPSRTFVINFDTGTLTESRVNRSRFYNTVNVDKERLLLGVDWSRQSISKFMEGYDDDGLPVTRTYVSGLNDIGDPFIWKNLYVVGVEADDAGQIEVTLFDENEGRLKTFTIQGGTISVWDGFNWDAGMWAGDFASTGTEVGRVATMLGRRYGFSLLTKTSGLYIIRALRLTVRPRSERFGRGRWK